MGPHSMIIYKNNNILTIKMTESTVDKNIGLLATVLDLEGHLYITYSQGLGISSNSQSESYSFVQHFLSINGARAQ